MVGGRLSIDRKVSQLIDYIFKKTGLNNNLWQLPNFWYVVNSFVAQFVGKTQETTMLRVLMFLLENYKGPQALLVSDQEKMGAELEKAGFSSFEIHDALAWLQGFKDFSERISSHSSSSATTIRVFAPEEVEKIGVDGQGLILLLELSKILNSTTRELVIDRVMALDGFVNLSQIKWIILMTLFHYPEENLALHGMQDLILHSDVLH